MRFDPFSDPDEWARDLLTGWLPGAPRTPRFLPMDLVKSGDQYTLMADLPGADPGSIDLVVDNGVLTLSASRAPSPEEEGVQWLANERFSGTYRRQVTLGEGVDPSRVRASYDDGVLTVTIPLAERAQPRKISVEAAHAPQQIAAGSGGSPP
jgi:HSP20 family protein